MIIFFSNLKNINLDTGQLISIAKHSYLFCIISLVIVTVKCASRGIKQKTYRGNHFIEEHGFFCKYIYNIPFNTTYMYMYKQKQTINHLLKLP